MAIDYTTLLTDEQKRSLLNQRLQQFAAEAFQHTLNKQVAEVSGNTVAVEQADEALAILDTAITVHQDELGKLA